MFTGIIQKLGQVTQAQVPHLRIETGFDQLELGESIAVNGVCLTVAEFQGGEALFSVSPETLDRTSLGRLAPGRRVNLERAMTAHTRLSGHIVQGHVDGQGRLLRVEPRAESYFLEFEVPATLGRYLVEKGSITIDGISLTLNRVTRPDPSEAARFEIMIIPHTWTHTQLSDLRAGDSVNIEIDILAKYVEQLCQPYRKP